MDTIQRFREAESALFARLDLEPRERFIELATGRTRVLEFGTGEPVLFVHGGGGYAATFAPLIAKLNGIRAIVPDRPGCGLSSFLDYRSVPALRPHAVAFLGGVLDALDLQRVPIVANSMGGLWSLWFALEHGDRVESMLQLGTPSFILDTSAPLPMRLMSIRWLGGAMTSGKATRKRFEQMYKMMGHRIELPEDFVTLGMAAQDLQGSKDSFRTLIQKGIRLRGQRVSLTEAELRCIEAPVLYLWGDRDAFGGLEVARKAAAATPRASLEILPGAAHLPWIDDAASCAERITKFLGVL